MSRKVDVEKINTIWDNNNQINWSDKQLTNFDQITSLGLWLDSNQKLISERRKNKYYLGQQ